MTDERKAELFDKIVDWVFEHCWDDDEYRRVLEHIGMNEKEMIDCGVTDARYVSKFIRRDGRVEIYWWRSESEAKAHMRLFSGDESDLYAEILVLDEDDNVLDRLTFDQPKI